MSSQSPLLRIGVPLVLLSLSAVAYYTVWRVSVSNGTFIHIHNVLSQGVNAKMPGTDFPLIWKYTGIAAVDRTLVVFVTFFAPAVDGSTEGFAVWAMSQFGAGWCVMMMEGLRLGNERRIVSWVALFGTLMQFITFGVTAPLWMALHLLTSPVAQPDAPSSSLFISDTDLKILPLAVFLGYVFPSLLMGFPSPKQTSPEAHQWFIVLWQPFPIITSVLRYVLPPVFQYRLDQEEVSEEMKFLTADSAPVAYLKRSKSVYLFGLTLCMVTQCLTIYSIYLNNNFVAIFVPFFFTNPGEQVPNLAVGVKDFLQFDVYTGLTAFLIWSTYLYMGAQSARKVRGANWFLAVKVVFWAVLSGPMGVVLVLLGARDDVVLREEVAKEKKEN